MSSMINKVSNHNILDVLYNNKTILSKITGNKYKFIYNEYADPILSVCKKDCKEYIKCESISTEELLDWEWIVLN